MTMNLDQSLISAPQVRGGLAVVSGIENGATHLNCYEPLSAYYRRFGFDEVRREANWTAGGDDVVFMELNQRRYQSYKAGHWLVARLAPTLFTKIER